MKKKKKFFCLFLVCAFFLAVSGGAFAEGEGTMEDDAPMPPTLAKIGSDRMVFANGTSIIVERGSTSEKTKVGYREGSNLRYVNFGTEATPKYEADLSGWAIYGGKRSEKARDTKIVMTGGKVGFIFGGGYGAGSSVQNTLIEISFGKSTAVYGGGNEGSIVFGSTEIRYFGGSALCLLGGGSSGSTVKGDARLTIDGASSISGIYGGGSRNAQVEGDSYIFFKHGNSDYIYGGGSLESPLLGTSHISVTGGKVSAVVGSGSDRSPVGATDIFISEQIARLQDLKAEKQSRVKGKKNAVILYPNCSIKGFDNLLWCEIKNGERTYLTKGHPIFPAETCTIPEGSKFYVNRKTSIRFSEGSKVTLKGFLKSYGGILSEGELELESGAKVILADALMDVKEGNFSVRKGASLTVDPIAALAFSGISSARIQKGAYFRVFETARFYLKDSAALNIEEGATILARLSTFPHNLLQEQLSRFTVGDFEYTGEDLKYKVEPNYRGLKLDLSIYAVSYQRWEDNDWKAVDEVRDPGTYRVNYGRGSAGVSFTFRVLNTVPEENFQLKVTPEKSIDFGEAEVGYGSLRIPLIYENVGNRDIPNLETVLECDSAGCFETSAPAKLELLRIGERAEYFICPKAGLSAGTYQGVLKVFSSGKVERKVNLSFTVKSASPPPNPPDPPNPPSPPDPPSPPNPPNPPNPPSIPIEEPYRVWAEKIDVPTDKEWQIAFSRAVDPESVNKTNIFMVRADRLDQPLEAELRVSEDGKTVHIRPKGKYQSGRKYYLIIQKLQTKDGTVLKENILMPFVIAS